MRSYLTKGMLVLGSWTVAACSGSGNATLPAESEQLAPPQAFLEVTDPTLLSNPDLLRATHGLPGDGSPLAFSLVDPRSKSASPRAIAPSANTSCPSPEVIAWHDETVSAGLDVATATAASCDAVYEVGQTSGALRDPLTPGGFLPYGGGVDLYVIKRRLDGSVAWAKQLGGPGNEHGTAVVATSCADGHVYVAGYGGATQFDILLYKFTADGTLVWQRAFGSPEQEQTWGMALDASGNVYLTGQTKGQLPNGGISFPSKPVTAFLVKYQPDGTNVWARQLGVNNRTIVSRAVAISGNEVYITGTTTASFDGNILSGTADAFVVHYDSNGNRQVTHSRFVGTTSSDSGYGITVGVEGPDHFIYATGFTLGAFPGKVNQGVGTWDAFVRKYDATLTLQWTDQLGGSRNVNTTGNMIGYTNDTIVLSGSTERGVRGADEDLGSFDIFLTRYRVDGTVVTTTYFGTNSREVVYGLGLDQWGNPLIVGFTDGAWCGHAFGGGGADAINLRYMIGCLVNSPDPRCMSGGGSGDPHFFTFDKYYYDQQSAGTMVLAKDDNDPFFQVHVRQCGGPRVTVMNAVGMKIGLDQVEYHANGDIYINGLLTPVPTSRALPHGGVIYSLASGTGKAFAWPTGDRVVARTWGARWMSVFVVAEPWRAGSLRGLLGNADGDRTNEFMLDREGTDIRSSLTFYEMYKAPNSFAEVWRADPMFDNQNDFDLITHGVDCTNPAYPSEPTWLHNLTPAQREAGETACAGIADETAREPCVLDVGLTGETILAQAATDVVTQLANQGVVAPPLPTPRVVYFNNFEGEQGSEWDSVIIGSSPLGDRTFLGTFGNETVRLTLNNLSNHNEIIISFDLFIINAWDGDGVFGPNTWKAAVDGVEVANYTFSNTFSIQSYPVFGSLAGTGALETNSLFYPYGDSIYRVTLTVPHTAPSLALDLAAENLFGIFGEAWAVSNFEVQGNRATAPLLAPSFTTYTKKPKSVVELSYRPASAKAR